MFVTLTLDVTYGAGSRVEHLEMIDCSTCLFIIHILVQLKRSWVMTASTVFSLVPDYHLQMTYEFNTILIVSFFVNIFLNSLALRSYKQHLPFQISKHLPVSLVTIVAETMMDPTTLIAKLQPSFENAFNTGDLLFFPSTVIIHIDSDIEVIDIVEGLERILQFTD